MERLSQEPHQVTDTLPHMEKVKEMLVSGGLALLQSCWFLTTGLYVSVRKNVCTSIDNVSDLLRHRGDCR